MSTELMETILLDDQHDEATRKQRLTSLAVKILDEAIGADKARAELADIGVKPGDFKPLVDVLRERRQVQARLDAAHQAGEQAKEILQKIEAANQDLHAAQMRHSALVTPLHERRNALLQQATGDAAAMAKLRATAPPELRARLDEIRAAVEGLDKNRYRARDHHDTAMKNIQICELNLSLAVDKSGSESARIDLQRARVVADGTAAALADIDEQRALWLAEQQRLSAEALVVV